MNHLAARPLAVGKAPHAVADCCQQKHASIDFRRSDHIRVLIDTFSRSRVGMA